MAGESVRKTASIVEEGGVSSLHLSRGEKI
jgi:hypothetical protein